MQTIGGGAFAGGLNNLQDKCIRLKPSGYECLRAILFSLITGAVYGAGLYGDAYELFKKDLNNETLGLSDDEKLSYPHSIEVHFVDPRKQSVFEAQSENDKPIYLNPHDTVDRGLFYQNYLSNPDFRVNHGAQVENDGQSTTQTHDISVLHTFDNDKKFYTVHSMDEFASDSSKRDDNNDRWTFSYSANSQFNGSGQQHFPHLPNSVVTQMTYDLLGKLTELNADNICIDFGGSFGLWGKLQVTNSQTFHQISPTQCNPYYNNDYKEGTSWKYTYQYHDEL
ncbi:hypothetical protein E3Q19_03311 [Wallemia mellicola]|nr:hypothetical protein E3Q19_03311 [Wallemia mellicola]